MSTALRESLAPLTVESEALEYAKVGIHARHLAHSEHLVDIANAFTGAGYYLEMVTCQDRREEHASMRLCYTFSRLPSAEQPSIDRHLLHVDVAQTEDAESEFSTPSLAGVISGANWHERETHEMYGVVFEGHPELERLLLPEDADFYPLRKDFGRIEDAEDDD